ncbi:MAG: aminotransferase class V-fold PLP-dependent enzyme, partial [Bacteroidia bacterium]
MLNRRRFLAWSAAAAPLALQSRSLLNDTQLDVHLAQEALEQGDWSRVRALFPLDKNTVFLNNGTMGVSPYPVLEASIDSLKKSATKAHYPGHDGQLESLLAETIGANKDEIAITKNVSEGINHIAWGIALKKGDEIILSSHEHVGGCAAWLHRARLDGLSIKVIDLKPTADQTLEAIESAISSRTRVIALPHIPCTIGQVLPVKDICDLARSRGIVSVLDGAHPLGMIPFNLHEIGCDYYAGCLHKWALGPLGTGYLYIRKERLAQTRCTHVAAYSLDAFNMNAQPPALGELVDSAARFSYGSFSGALMDGAIAALEFYRSMGPERIAQRSLSLAADLQEKLMNSDISLEMLTPAET